MAERTVRNASGERTVILYEVAGLDFTPEFVWLDRDGTYFASASTWLTTVREGWESAVPKLLEAQTEAEAVRAKELVKAASRQPGRPLVFRGANLFDAETATSRKGMTVVVSGERITAVGPDGAVPVPEGAEVIDAAGRTLLPGLWDMHVHVSDLDGPLNIQAGVTSVRDLANDIDALAALSRSWKEGTAIGPRVIAAGFLDGPGPYAGPTKVLVDTPEEARAAVARYASLGYPQIKVYSSIRPELVPVIIAEAHQRGMRVSGHVPAFMTADQFVRLGADELQHANFLFLNFWGDTVKDTRTPLRFTAVAQNAAELDLDSERVRAFLALLKEHGTVSDPTVAIFEEMFVGRPGTVSPGYAAIADRLPVQVRRRPADRRAPGARRKRPALPGLVPRRAQDGPPPGGRGDPDRGRNRLARRFHARSRARALRRGGHPRAPGAPDRDSRGRARDEEGRGAGLDRGRQAGGPRARRGGPVGAHFRRASGGDGRQERRRLRPGAISRALGIRPAAAAH